MTETVISITFPKCELTKGECDILETAIQKHRSLSELNPGPKNKTDARRILAAKLFHAICPRYSIVTWVRDNYPKELEKCHLHFNQNIDKGLYYMWYEDLFKQNNYNPVTDFTPFMPL